jgi:hypothetical protein
MSYSCLFPPRDNYDVAIARGMVAKAGWLKIQNGYAGAVVCTRFSAYLVFLGLVLIIFSGIPWIGFGVTCFFACELLSNVRLALLLREALAS